MPNSQELLPIHLDEGMLSDLKNLVAVEGEIRAIMDTAGRANPASNIRKFSARVAEVTGHDVRNMIRVLYSLVSIRRMANRREINGQRILELLSETLREQAPERWVNDNLDSWEKAVPVIQNAVDLITVDHPLMISEKAETLAYSDDNILTSHRIITEIRPVFDDAGTSIKETLILHTLLLEHYDGITGIPKRFALTLDSADIEALRQSCERAVDKTKVTLAAMKDLNPIDLPEPLER